MNGNGRSLVANVFFVFACCQMNELEVVLWLFLHLLDPSTVFIRYFNPLDLSWVSLTFYAFKVIFKYPFFSHTFEIYLHNQFEIPLYVKFVTFAVFVRLLLRGTLDEHPFKDRSNNKIFKFFFKRKNKLSLKRERGFGSAF